MCNNTEVMFHMKRQLVNTPTLYIKEKSTTQKSNIHAVELEREQMLTKDIKWQNTSNEDPEVPTELSER